MSKAKKEAKRQARYAHIDAGEDIRYRGPLSYRAFKILGWVCILLSQVAMLLTLEAKLDPTMTDVLQAPITTLNSLSGLALPLLLIANFALILNHSEGYGAQIRRYAVLSGLVLAVSVILFSRYAVGTAAILLGTRADALALLQTLFWSGGPGYVAYNLFIDLLLCALVMYFLNYRPKRVFVGKKLGVFRAFAALPLLYEAASIALKALSSAGKVQLPLIVYPFLTVKPPMTFLVFVVMAAFIKTREVRFRRGGRTHEAYEAFLKTKRNSWEFSVFTAKLLAVAGVVDLIAAFVFVMVKVDLDGDVSAINVTAVLSEAAAFELGESASLLLLAPVMLLFSYTRTHKNKIFDTLIPAIGVAAIVVAYIEGLYQFFLMLPDMIGASEVGSAFIDVFSELGGPLG